jgi:hypothetical protein
VFTGLRQSPQFLPSVDRGFAFRDAEPLIPYVTRTEPLGGGNRYPTQGPFPSRPHSSRLRQFWSIDLTLAEFEQLLDAGEIIEEHRVDDAQLKELVLVIDNSLCRGDPGPRVC